MIFVKSRQQTLQITCRSEILSKSLSNGFPDKCVLRFMQKFKMATKKWRESDFCKMSPVHSTDTLWVQNFVEIALSCTASEINALLRLMQKFKMAAKSGGEAIVVKSPVDPEYTQRVKNFIEITLSRTISEINALLHFTQKFKMAAKIAGKRFLLKVASRLFIYPAGQKFH